jgi:hypothetical protein
MQRKKKFRIPRKKIVEKVSIDMQSRLESLHTQIRAELGGRTLPDLAEVIHREREVRDEQLLENLVPGKLVI